LKKHAKKIRDKLESGEEVTRNKRSIWEISTENLAESHFAPFPEALVEPMILAGSNKQDVVLDIFAGSGTTIRVAKRLGRKGIGIELNPEYIKIANKLNSDFKKIPIDAEQFADLNELLALQEMESTSKEIKLDTLLGLSRVKDDNLKE